jgi:hypothetical protein
MFENITSALKAHKQIVIAAIAITGLITYSLPTNFLASAQSVFFPNLPNLPVTIDRDITIPCRPYCNIANEPEDVNRDVDDILHLHLGFSFV